jgi:hypothetical protein
MCRIVRSMGAITVNPNVADNLQRRPAGRAPEVADPLDAGDLQLAGELLLAYREKQR